MFPSEIVTGIEPTKQKLKLQMNQLLIKFKTSDNNTFNNNNFDQTTKSLFTPKISKHHINNILISLI